MNEWAAQAGSNWGAMQAGGLLKRLLRFAKARVGSESRRRPRLAQLERISLTRQSLTLIEAEGRKLLVATSPEGMPVFYPLDGSVLTEPPVSANNPLRRGSC